MSVLSTVVQLIVVISCLIILHEIGHYIGAKIFKLDVDEFGIGIPPQLFRYWRIKGHIKIGNSKIKVPAGIKVLKDIEVGTWVDTRIKIQDDSTKILQQLQVIDAPEDDPPIKETINRDGSVQIVGKVTESTLGMVFTINMLPLGGFVKIRGEGDTTITDGLAAANPWKRLVVYSFGPLMNLLLGIVLYTVIGTQIGIEDYSQVLIVHISENSPAEAAGVQIGDIVYEFEGISIDSIEKLQDLVSAKKGEDATLSLLRSGESIETHLVPRESYPPDDGSMGVGLAYPIVAATYLEAIPWGIKTTYSHAKELLTLPAQIIKGGNAEEARLVGYKGMYDIYTYVQNIETAPEIPKSINTIYFITTITISLGLLNLLPIPALDGGRILFALPEILIRRKIPIGVQNFVNLISFTIMILFFIYINILDFVKPLQLP
jgi:regulator of sigma E protease